MGEATRALRAQNPNLKGPDLFREGAVLAHQLIDSGRVTSRSAL
jgi:hypothetical protein